MGWWFGRTLTFEVEADQDGIPVLALLSEISDGCIDAAAEGSITGWAAYSSSMRSAIEPVVDSFGVEIADDGRRPTSPDDGAVETIEPVDLGCRSDGEQACLLERDRTARHLLPSSVAVAYYDR